MYRHLSEFIVKLADLCEAEGRVLREVVARLGLGISLTIVASTLLLLGLLTLMVGVWLGLAQPLGPAWASAIVGLLLVGMSGGLLAIAHKLSR